VIELKQPENKKRARRKRTRPEPTIKGNCDSWDFIVGKKAKPQSLEATKAATLRACNTHVIHNFSTALPMHRMDNVWVNSRTMTDVSSTFRIVDFCNFNMPVIAFRASRFYRIK